MFDQGVDQGGIDERGRGIDQDDVAGGYFRGEFLEPGGVEAAVEFAGLQKATAPAVGPAAGGRDGVQRGHGATWAFGQHAGIERFGDRLDLGELIFPAEDGDRADGLGALGAARWSRRGRGGRGTGARRYCAGRGPRGAARG